MSRCRRTRTGRGEETGQSAYTEILGHALGDGDIEMRHRAATVRFGIAGVDVDSELGRKVQPTLRRATV